MTAAKPEAVVIGASAGALNALAVILPELPENYPLPVLVVVHIPPGKESLLAQLLQEKCRVTVKEAEDKEPVKPSHVYLAPPDYHLLVEREKYLSLSSDEPVLFSRPSIDVLFETAADAYGSGLIGVILTGGNNDGAEGLRLVVRNGGTAVIQKPEEALAPHMPVAALGSCPDAHVLSLKEIATYLCKAGMG